MLTRRHVQALSALIAVMCTGRPAAAQEATVLTAIAVKPSVLQDRLDAPSRSIAVPANTRLSLLPDFREGEFAYASLLDGTEGWIPAAHVQVTSWLPAGTPDARARTQACPTSIDACPDEGCTGDPTHKIDPLLNRVKNAQLSARPARRITWPVLAELQAHVDNTLRLRTGFGTQLTAQQRRSLKRIRTSAGTLGEGMLVSLDGFISTQTGTAANPHAGGAESCNCGLTGDENVDWHINLGPSATSDEFHGIVVEVTPHHRVDEWTLDSLAALAAAHAKVRISGQLLFDNAHKIRRTPDENKRGNPARFSLWEIHPIVAMKALPTQ
jgi:hypothetical protein